MTEVTNNEPRIVFSMLLGTVELGRPIGWRTDERGYSYRVYTDTITRDQHGNIVKREPREDVIGIKFDPDEPRRPWWKRAFQ